MFEQSSLNSAGVSSNIDLNPSLQVLSESLNPLLHALSENPQTTAPFALFFTTFFGAPGAPHDRVDWSSITDVVSDAPAASMPPAIPLDAVQTNPAPSDVTPQQPYISMVNSSLFKKI